jgi:crossover junction endodeoxyribonuclease RuvC
MNILGLDVSTFTGLVLLDGVDQATPPLTKLLHFGKWATGMKRAQLIARGVAEFMAERQPDVLVFEGLAFGNKNTLVTLTEIQASIKLEALKQKLSWYEVPPTVLKLWTAGKGNATKAEMATAVQSRWNFMSQSDDVVDAYALAQIGVVLHLQKDEKLRKKVVFVP